jgi:hypothetical protein
MDYCCSLLKKVPASENVRNFRLSEQLVAFHKGLSSLSYLFSQLSYSKYYPSVLQ